ncbi:hypothetical protein M409DRAFT_61275 [Zasmidium cellare ATCC 36951]|uniref:Xylanolytic transcriptional activator regulatory domain-containing protein n=1 Tax=Zasmidium cellare ATCC 36951 TaxID=1080233 RepID=A0A6A6BZ34_ZASCE|nr:uncharacterized protein M409DRAFT_61275 [Zasmidium cellare ATCC 36951]KAF2158852.1 hypothetical protein M409DRAFT_61275 [Zasmidium cellare ATCC 36951]
MSSRSPAPESGNPLDDSQGRRRVRQNRDLLSGQWKSMGGEACPTNAPSGVQDESPGDRSDSKATKSEDPPDQIRPYRGATSSDFSFQVASGGSQPLRRSSGEGAGGTPRGFEINTIVSSEILAASKPLARLVFNDPLQEMKYSEVIRLVSVFNSGPGLLYPIVETVELLQTVERVFQLLRESEKPQTVQRQITAAEELNSTKTLTLKLVIANALTLESRQISRLAQRHFDSVRESLGSSFWSLPSLGGIVNWILVALLHFHLDEELQASRVAAHAARLCLEMGINRKDANCTFKTPQDALLATKVVWAVFVLDRRSSIALGIPFVVQDSDLNTVMETPDPDSIYLETVVRLSRIAGEACRLASRISDRSVPLSTADIDFLDYQISQWQLRLPPNLQFNRAELQSGQFDPFTNESSLYMSSILFLRANQLRNLIHRPALYSADRITANEQYPRTAIDVACEAVQVLHELNSSTGLVERHAVFFKYFLVSAFSSLLLAIAKAPVSYTATRVGLNVTLLAQLKQSFYRALDMFKLFGTRAPSLLHLWESVNSLEAWAVQMGLPSRAESGDLSWPNAGGFVLPPQTLDTETSSNPAPVINGAWLEG